MISGNAEGLNYELLKAIYLGTTLRWFFKMLC